VHAFPGFAEAGFPGCRRRSAVVGCLIMRMILLAIFLGAGAGVAQEFVAPAGRQREIVPTVEQTRPTIEGMVKEIFTRKPWQAINPLAPKSYGSGEKFVSRDFGPGTPHHAPTLTVVGVEW